MPCKIKSNNLGKKLQEKLSFLLSKLHIGFFFLSFRFSDLPPFQYLGIYLFVCKSTLKGRFLLQTLGSGHSCVFIPWMEREQASLSLNGLCEMFTWSPSKMFYSQIARQRCLDSSCLLSHSTSALSKCC